MFEPRGGRTVLAHAHATAPLRVGSTFAVDDAALLILVCAGPGIFCGDSLTQTVVVKRGARAVLVSQSALQVHPSRSDRPARVRQRYRVEAGGELHCHWDPVIPFVDAELDQRFEVDLAEGARWYWSDALMCGRTARGEAWRFRALAHELRVQIDGSLQYLERYRISPSNRDVTQTWIANDSRYFATTLVHHERLTVEHAEALQASLQCHAGVNAGVDVVGGHLLASRLVASSGVPFTNARNAVRTFACASIFASPGLAIRK